MEFWKKLIEVLELIFGIVKNTVMHNDIVNKIDTIFFIIINSFINIVERQYNIK